MPTRINLVINLFHFTNARQKRTRQWREAWRGRRSGCGVGGCFMRLDFPAWPFPLKRYSQSAYCRDIFNTRLLRRKEWRKERKQERKQEGFYSSSSSSFRGNFMHTRRECHGCTYFPKLLQTILLLPAAAAEHFYRDLRMCKEISSPVWRAFDMLWI